MSLTCELAQNISKSCEFPPVKGTNDEIYIIEKDNISGITEDVNNPLLVSAITKVATEKGFKYEFLRNSLTPSVELVRDEFGERWKQGVMAKIAGATPEVKLELLRLAGTKVVVIVKNNYGGDADGKSKYEMFGYGTGLTLTVATDTDNNKVYSIELMTEDGYEDGKPPRTVFDTSETVTKAMLDALLVASS